MLQELLRDALYKAKQSSAAVRAAALLHIARVMTAFDTSAAVRTLEEGIAVATDLAENDRSVILTEAVSLAAAVSPDHAFRLPQFWECRRDVFGADKVIRAMLDHGHIAEAVAYLSTASSGEPYPFAAAMDAMGYCRDDRATQSQILRAAVESWRSLQKTESGRLSSIWFSHFSRLFNLHWRVLPLQESAQAVRDIVDWILREPDQRSKSSFARIHPDVQFSSMREWNLFQILGPLHDLDPGLVDSLLGEYWELAAAHTKFPYGSYAEARLTDRTAVPEDTPIECLSRTAWDDIECRWVTPDEWLEKSFVKALKRSLDLYANDTASDNPNRAPRECWPSTQEFRRLFHLAGKYEGLAASKRLEQIPDPDLRLFAQIELAAALAELPQIGGTSIFPAPAATYGRDSEIETLPLVARPLIWTERGQAREVQTYVSERGSAEETWSASRLRSILRYRRDRQVEQNELWTQAGSPNRYEYDYDERGKLIAATFWRNQKLVSNTVYFYDERERLIRAANEELETEKTTPRLESGLVSIPIMDTIVSVSLGEDLHDIPQARIITTSYSEQTKPIEIFFYGANQALLCRRRLRWNTAGLLVSEERLILPGFDLPTETESVDSPEMQDMLDSMPNWVTSYSYDQAGTCREQVSTLNLHTEIRTTFLYDAHGNPVERIEVTSSNDRAPGTRHWRYDYRYDEQGNWTERLTSQRTEPNSEFKPWSIEWRTIAYYTD